MPDVIAAIISALALVALAFLNFRMQRQLQAIKASLEEAQAERDARLDYEYEARKRLYSELQPLLFQLKELSEGAYRWVMSVFRLINRRLTIVDFSVDKYIRVQYNITRQIYLSISDGFSIAKAGDHPIPYEPHEVRRLRRYASSIAPQQHLFRGHLDKIADALVVRDPDGPRCMTYGEFETQFRNPRSDVYRTIRALADGFRGFEPRSRPVVWRMLIVQMYFHKALLHTFEPDPATFNQKTATFLGSPADLLSDEEREELDWRDEDSNVPREEVLVWPFKAAEEYVGERLRGFFRIDA